MKGVFAFRPLIKSFPVLLIVIRNLIQKQYCRSFVSQRTNGEKIEKKRRGFSQYFRL